MWKLRTGIDAVHVPYKGIGASYTDMMSNKVQMAFSSIAGALPFTATTASFRWPRQARHARRSIRSADGGRGGIAGLRGRSVARPLGTRRKCRPTYSRNSMRAINKALQDPGLKNVICQIRPDARAARASPKAPSSLNRNTRNGRRSSKTATSHSIDDWRRPHRRMSDDDTLAEGSAPAQGSQDSHWSLSTVARASIWPPNYCACAAQAPKFRGTRRANAAPRRQA